VAVVKGKRRMIRSALIVAGAYVAILVGGRLEYRRFVYPAPPPEPLAVPDGFTLLRLSASDAVAVHALLLPPKTSTARTMVLFHGNGERMEWGADLAERLWARGFGVVLAEYRGYGRSAADGVVPSQEGLYRDAEAVLDALGAEGTPPSRIVVWGTSLGTGVAAEMARRGRASALILASPYTSIRALGAHHVPILPMSLVIPDRFDTLRSAPTIRVPTLVIHGDADEIIPYAMGQAVARAIPGARLVTVAGGHHNDLFAVAGERLLDEVTAFASH
jgi:pimeloyl-ACP methyl ester carboxylesterase